MFRTIVSILMLIALAVTEAEGAVLAGVEGAVSIARGGSVINASEGAAVAPGDSVRTGEGTARIVYENGCIVRLGPREAVAVAAAPPLCAPPVPAFLSNISFEDVAVTVGAVLLILVVAVIGPAHSKT
jgi:hypothetical protein